MPVLTSDTQNQVVNFILEQGLADPEAVKKTQGEAITSGQPLLATLAAQKIVDNSIIAHATAAVMSIPYVNLENTTISQDILLTLPQDVAERNMAVPVGEINEQLIVAMLDTTNIQAIDYLSTLVQKPIRGIMSSEAGIRHVLSQYRADFSNVKQAVKATNAEARQQANSSNIKTITQDSPISRALTTILEFAAKSKASDIHIEPLEGSLTIRTRIDGVLRRVMELPKSIEPALVSRIKILAGLKIDEHRIPQDGQFTVLVGDKEIDLRIAISPVVWGEQVVIRLLDKSGGAISVEQMGVTGRALRSIRIGISKPNGMVLTSGPTGSGKTTTLYALIKEIKNEAINIVTLEDPVEYKMDGVNQIQVNTEAGLTFASGLRSILRQDPDVVMVGEIRDSETANLAVQAALTGHLVFSTLHTNSAAGILPRLLDMGIEPFLIASTLNTVIGQRLIRRVAEKREAYQSSDVETRLVRSIVGRLLPKSSAEVTAVSEDLGYAALPLADSSAYTLVRGIDSPDTPGGFGGRAGIFEAIEVDDDIQKLIVSRATAGDIMKVAKMKGMVSMREDGVLKSLSGLTTLSEVNRVASDIA